MNINPCPNPKCDGKEGPPAAFFLDQWRCGCPSCELCGPGCATPPRAIAAWNSISMAPIPPLPEGE